MPEILIAPNVSCVPIYSPLRYPGGKSRLYPFVIGWIENLKSPVKFLVEPFAGAAHIGLAAVIEDRIPRAILVEKDEDIAAVWKTILSDDCQWLIDKIIHFKLTGESVRSILNQTHSCDRELAFKVLLRNRVSRSGISAPGAGILETGENGKGIRSRWYPGTLRQRLSAIHKVKNFVQFVEGDGVEILRKYSNDEQMIFFIDPPYPNAGRRLYKYFDVDPSTIFKIASTLQGDFLITYDDSAQILNLVNLYQLQWRKILMHTAHHRKKYELLIGRDLSWVDNIDL